MFSQILTDMVGPETQQELVKNLAFDKNSATRQMIDNHISKAVHDLMPKPSTEKPPVKIVYKLDSKSKASLVEIFPEFALHFDERVYHPHAYAASARVLEKLVLMDLIRLNKAEELMKRFDDYDFYAIELGGVASDNIKRGNRYIHSCEPNIDLYDSQRKTSRMLSLAKTTDDEFATQARQLISEGHHERMVCNQKFQDCACTAPYGIAVHSIYNVKPEELVNGMDKKKMLCLYGTMTFDPIMLTDNQGHLKDLNVDYSISEKGEITYSFKNDSSFAYKHDISNLIKYMTKSHFVSALGKHYVMELIGNRKGIQFFKITYVDSDFCSDTPLIRPIYFSHLEGKTEIQCFDFDYAENSTNPNPKLLMGKTIFVETDIYEATLGYTMRLEENRFQPKCVYDYLLSQMAKTIDDGKNIRIEKPRIGAADLYDIAAAIYMIAYKHKWQQSKIIQTTVDEQKRLREYGTLGFFTKTWKRLCFLFEKDRKKRNLGTYNVKKKFDPQVLFTQMMAKKSITHKYYKSYQKVYCERSVNMIDLTWGLPYFKGKSLHQRMESEIMDAFINHIEESKISRTESRKDKKKMQDLENRHGGARFDVEMSTVNDYVEGFSTDGYAGNIVSCIGIDHTDAHFNAGAGNCLYLALLQSEGIMTPEDHQVEMLKKELLMLEKSHYMQKVVDSMNDNLKTPRSHAIDTIIDLYARYKRVNICYHRHEGDCCLCTKHGYNVGKTRHIYHYSNHYVLLRTDKELHLVSGKVVERDFSDSEYKKTVELVDNRDKFLKTTITEEKPKHEEENLEEPIDSNEKHQISPPLTQEPLVTETKSGEKNVPEEVVVKPMRKFLNFLNRKKKEPLKIEKRVPVETPKKIEKPKGIPMRRLPAYVHRSFTTNFYRCQQHHASVPFKSEMRTEDMVERGLYFFSLEHFPKKFFMPRDQKFVFSYSTEWNFACIRNVVDLPEKSHHLTCYDTHEMKQQAVDMTSVDLGKKFFHDEKKISDNHSVLSLLSGSYFISDTVVYVRCLAGAGLNHIREEIRTLNFHKANVYMDDKFNRKTLEHRLKLSQACNGRVVRKLLSFENMSSDVIINFCDWTLKNSCFENHEKILLYFRKMSAKRCMLIFSDYDAGRKFMRMTVEGNETNMDRFKRNEPNKKFFVSLDFDEFENLDSEIQTKYSVQRFCQLKKQLFQDRRMEVPHHMRNRGQMKLTEILARYSIDYHTALDVCSNPGGFALALHDYKPYARSICVAMYYDSGIQEDNYDMSKKENVHVIPMEAKLDYYGDITDERQVDHICSRVGEVDLVTADGCSDDGPLDELNHQILRGEIAVSKGTVGRGGSFILKFFINEAAIFSIIECASQYKFVDICKPRSSGPMSMELYAVMMEKTPEVHDHSEKIIADCEKFFKKVIKEMKNFLSNPAEVTKFAEEMHADPKSDVSFGDSSHDDEISSEIGKDHDDDFDEDTARKVRMVDELLDHGIDSEKISLALKSNELKELHSKIFNTITRVTNPDFTVTETCGGQQYILHPLKNLSAYFPREKMDVLENWSGIENRYKPYFEIPTEDIRISYRNAMREIRCVWENTEAVRLSALRGTYRTHSLDLKFSHGSKMILRENPKNFGVYCPKTRKWLLKPKNGVVEYQLYCDGEKMISDPHSSEKLLLVDEECIVCTERKLYNAVKELNMYVLQEFSHKSVQGVPGCGKTRYITDEANDGDLVLTSTRESREDISKRLVDAGKRKVVARTVHSYLINDDKKYNRVLVDEALMRHFGELLYVVLKSGCSEIVIIGDKAQIPYFNRTPSFVTVMSQTSDYWKPDVMKNMSFRCPHDVAYLFRKTYDDGFKSCSKVVKSMNFEKINSPAEIPREEGHKYLVFKKTEKQTLTELGFKNVSTIGETQGCEFKNVILIRLSTKAVDEIYDNTSQQLVGMTRHRETMTYYSVMEDKISRMLASIPDESEMLHHTKVKNRFGAGEIQYGDFDRIEMINENCKIRIFDTLLKDIVDLNFGTDHSALQFKLTQAVERKFFIPKGINPTCGGIEALQSIYDDILPGNSLHDRRYDQEICERSFVIPQMGNVKIDHSKFAPLPQRKPTLVPLLRTSMPWTRLSSQIDAITGLLKRNLNVPNFDGEVDSEYFVSVVVKNFQEAYFDVSKTSEISLMQKSLVVPNDHDLTEWLREQPEQTRKQLIEAKCIYEMAPHIYSLMNKKDLKPSLDRTAPYEYSAVQTIASQSKMHNAIFCPMFRVLKDRLKAILPKNFMIYSDQSAEEFAAVFSKRFPLSVREKLQKLEIDIGKYDKSQHRLIFEVECEIYRLLGLHPMWIQIWRKAHEVTILRDRTNGVTAHVEYQRKSGDASTFFGNTMVLMAVMCTLYNLKNRSVIGIFAGDDSVLYTNEVVDRNEMCGHLFNLESKFFRYKYTYFCSKFVVDADDSVFFVPDPLKMLTKFGRHNVVNYDHAEEYRVSCIDVTKVYRNTKMYHQLQLAFEERYNCKIDISFLIGSILNVISTKESFAALFALPEYEKLCDDPSRPILD